MSIDIAVTEAKPDKLFYVVANMIIVNPTDKTCLLLKRSQREKVHPGKWAFPGGKLEHGDIAAWLEADGIATDGTETIENVLGRLAEREAKEECGLDVDGGSARIVSNKVFIRPDNVPVFLVIMTANYKGGEVVLEEDAFTDSAWATLDQFADYDIIPGLDAEARLALGETP